MDRWEGLERGLLEYIFSVSHQMADRENNEAFSGEIFY